jgi:hypothetical protein
LEPLVALHRYCPAGIQSVPAMAQAAGATVLRHYPDVIFGFIETSLP